jgi:hypothetical protein
LVTLVLVLTVLLLTFLNGRIPSLMSVGTTLVPFWSHFGREQQHIAGMMLNVTHYWRGMLLPGHAAFHASVPHTYDADAPDAEYDIDLN